MKLGKVISIVVAAIILFIAGYFTGSISTNDVTKEIRIGYQNSDNPNRVDYQSVFTNKENPSVIDNFLMIYINKEKIENVNVDVENPDIYIEINNPKESIGLIYSRLWFTNESAIIGMRNGEGWDKVEFYKIGKDDVNYIKEILSYE